MSKIKETIEVRPISGPDELQGACDDLRCFADVVRTAREHGDPITAERQAKNARWCAETALAIALHLESKEVGPRDERG